MTASITTQVPAGSDGATTPNDPAGLSAALSALRLVRAQASEARRTVFPVVVRDVLLVAHPRGAPCWQGKKQVLSKRGKIGAKGGTLRGVYRNCGGAKCPRCVEPYLDRAVRQCWRVWGEAALHVSRFTVKEWSGQERKRVRPLKADYAGRFLRVKLATGDVLVFTPGEAEGSEPVELPGEAVVEALLGAPAQGRRYTLPKRTNEMREEDSPEKPEHERWHTVTLARETPLRDALAAVEQALGLSLDWTALDESKSWWRALEATGLTPEQVDIARAALAPFDDQVRADADIRRAIADAARQRRDWLELVALEEGDAA